MPEIDLVSIESELLDVDRDILIGNNLPLLLLGLNTSEAVNGWLELASLENGWCYYNQGNEIKISENVISATLLDQVEAFVYRNEIFLAMPPNKDRDRIRSFKIWSFKTEPTGELYNAGALAFTPEVDVNDVEEIINDIEQELLIGAQHPILMVGTKTDGSDGWVLIDTVESGWTYYDNGNTGFFKIATTSITDDKVYDAEAVVYREKIHLINKAALKTPRMDFDRVWEVPVRATGERYVTGESAPMPQIDLTQVNAEIFDIERTLLLGSEPVYLLAPNPSSSVGGWDTLGIANTGWSYSDDGQVLTFRFADIEPMKTHLKNATAIGYLGEIFIIDPNERAEPKVNFERIWTIKARASGETM